MWLTFCRFELSVNYIKIIFITFLTIAVAVYEDAQQILSTCLWSGKTAQRSQSLFLVVLSVHLEAWSAGEGRTNKKEDCKTKGLCEMFWRIIASQQFRILLTYICIILPDTVIKNMHLR